jgi:hypothetical protein
MKSKKVLWLLVVLFSIPMLFTSCGAYKDMATANLQTQLAQRFKIARMPQYYFNNLKQGLNVEIKQTYQQFVVDKNVYSMSNSAIFNMPTVNYVRSMGFKDLGENDYTLTITLSRIDVNTWNGKVDIMLSVEMTNNSGETIFEQNVMSSGTNAMNVPNCLNEQYALALEQINWNKISSFFEKDSAPKQLAKEEPRKEVEGYGNTALESTIVRWDVQSRPAGADVFWRVVSKTPSVKSTNNKYLQTTPYEATKSLDIRGLSYENSGDVRIILRCEKEGYHSQEKEFNVRMIIDQEEISAFFRLVKVE